MAPRRPAPGRPPGEDGTTGVVNPLAVTTDMGQNHDHGYFRHYHIPLPGVARHDRRFCCKFVVPDRIG